MLYGSATKQNTQSGEIAKRRLTEFKLNRTYRVQTFFLHRITKKQKLWKKITKTEMWNVVYNGNG